jgi:hypothetical protein
LGKQFTMPHSQACPPRYNLHTYRVDWKSQAVRLSLVGKRQSIRFDLPAYYAHYAGYPVDTAELPAQLSVRKPIARATGAGLTDYLLSYNQEWVLKHDLELSEEAEAASDDLRLQPVSGVAGSGKSLILLYRTRLLRQWMPVGAPAPLPKPPVGGSRPPGGARSQSQRAPVVTPAPVVR